MVKEKTKSKTQRSNEHQAIKDWPESERPREKLLQLGPEGLSDGELLAVLLRIGATGQSAEDLARQLRFACLFSTTASRSSVPATCRTI